MGSEPAESSKRFGDALDAVGVRHDTLGDEYRTRLLNVGYAVIAGLLTDHELAVLRAEFEQCDLTTRNWPGTSGHDNGARCGGAPGGNEPLRLCALHPVLLAAAAQVLGPEFVLERYLQLRDPHPGGGDQALHQDVGPLVPPGLQPHRLIATWCLDDTTETNGSIRVVPGSHLVDPATFYPQWAYQVGAHHPDERLVVAPAGSLLVRVATVWHAGTENVAGHARRSISQHAATWDDDLGVDLRTVEQLPEHYVRLVDAV